MVADIKQILNVTNGRTFVFRFFKEYVTDEEYLILFLATEVVKQKT